MEYVGCVSHTHKNGEKNCSSSKHVQSIHIYLFQFLSELIVIDILVNDYANQIGAITNHDFF